MTSCSRFLLRYSALLFLTIVSSTGLFAQITIKIWNPFGSNHDWEEETNWIEVLPPSPDEIAKFENSSDSVFISSNQTVAGLVLNGGTIAGTGAIAVGGSMNWNGGRLTGSGTITFQTGAIADLTGIGAVATLDGWNLVNDGIVNQDIPLEFLGGSDALQNGEFHSNENLILNAGTVFSGAGWVILADTLIVNGTVTMAKLELLPTSVVIGSGILEITDSLKWDGAVFAGGGTVSILIGAVLSVSGNEGTLNGWTLTNAGTAVQNVDLTLNDGTLANAGLYELHASVLNGAGTSSFTNTDTLNVGVGAGSIAVPFTTSGTVSLQGGSLDVVGGGTAGGAFTIAEGDSIRFVESASTFNGPTFSGPGWLYVDDSVLVTNDVRVSKFDFTGYSGSLSGLATVEVTDSMRWGGGRLNGTGELIVGSGATMVTVQGDYLLTIDDHTLTNNGTVIQSIPLLAGGNAQVNNNGVYELTSDEFVGGNIYPGNVGPAAFNNDGNFISRVDIEAEIQIPFNNSGSVEVLDGILSLEAGGTSTGTFTIVDTALLVFPSGLYQMNTGTSSSGDGYLVLDGGTLAIGANVVMNKFDVDSGVVEGNGNLTVVDTVNWGSGTLGGGGELTVSADGTMLITAGLRAGARYLDERTLNNTGMLVQWADFNVKRGANIQNSGTYQLMGNHVIVADTGFESSVFVNSGNFEKLTGPPNGGGNGAIGIAFQNSASLMIESLSSLELTGDFLNVSNKALSGGDYVIFGSFTIPGDIDTNNASVTLSGGSILNPAGTSALSKLRLNKGEFTLDAQLFMTISDSLTNEGVFTIGPGCSLSVQKFTQAAGTTYFRSGSSGWLDPDGGIVEVTGGSFYGNGTILGDFHNSADLFIGDTIGTLSLSSGFIQEPTGVLHIDIGGMAQGVDLDNVSLPGGLARLDGTVTAKLINGFVPNLEQKVFDIVTSEGRDSVFDSVLDLDPGDGIRMIANYPSTALTQLVANFAPFFLVTLPDTTIEENQTLDFALEGGDVDEESMFFSLVSSIPGTTIDSSTGTFSWKPTYDQSGVHEIVFGVSDLFETTLDTAIVTVQNVNRLPVFTSFLPDTMVAEGQELSFPVAGFDPDLDSLLFELVEWPEGSSISASGLFTWTPSFSDSGSHIIVLSLGDGIGATLDTAVILVSNTNIPPLFVLDLPDTTVLENSTLTFTVTGSDFDLDALSFAKLEGPEGLSVSAAGNVEWAVSYDDSGTHNVVVSLFDGLATVLDTARIIVSNVNRLPSFVLGLPDTVIAEAQTLVFGLTAADPDSDALVFDLFSGPSGAGVSPDGQFSWTTDYSDSGTHTIVLSVSDGIGLIQDTVLVSVTNVNIPPVFEVGLPDTSIEENSLFSFTLTGSDFDLNALSFAKISGPADLTIAEAGDVEWQTTFEDSGAHLVIVSLFDGLATVLDTAMITVMNANRLPVVVQGLPDTTIAEAQTLSYLIAAADPDANPISFALMSGPAGAGITPGGQFSWTPTYTDSGSHSVIFSISDGIGEILDTADVFVFNTNIPPVFVSTVPDTTIYENAAFSFSISGSDFDLNALVFAKYEGPEGLSVSQAGEVEWTPGLNDSGTYAVVFSLSDGFASVFDTAMIVVANVNQLPVIVRSLPDTVIAEAQTLTYTIVAIDPDSDSVYFSISWGPEGAEVTADGQFSWTPTYADSGSHSVVFSLWDGISAMLDTAVIQVTNVNRAPSFVSVLPDTSIPEKSTLVFVMSGLDLDSDALSFSKVSGPDSLTVSSDGHIEWATSYSDSGLHSVVISLFDGQIAVLDTAAVIVVNVNRPPALTIGLPDTTISENDSLKFLVGALDPDGTPLEFSLVQGPQGSSVSAGGLFSWTPSYMQAGVDTVVLSVSDGIDAVMDTSIVTVLNLNRLPGALSLVSPADNDTVQLALPFTLEFRWTKSTDPDAEDTLRYVVRIQGPTLDTLVSVLDTSVTLELTGRLQSNSLYVWSVRVTDTHDSVDALGSFSFRTSATVTSVGTFVTLPEEYALKQNYPNPFNPSTTIAYDIPARSLVTVQVFNVIGQLISTLVDHEQAPGRYTVVWRGISESGVPVSSGIYLYRIHAKSLDSDREFILTRKLVLIK